MSCFLFAFLNFSSCCHVEGSPGSFGFALCQLTGQREIRSQRAIAWKHLLLSILVSSTSSFPPASVALLFFSLRTDSSHRFILKSDLLAHSLFISFKDSMEMNFLACDVFCFSLFFGAYRFPRNPLVLVEA